MGKLLAVIFVLIALVGGGIYYSASQGTTTPVNPIVAPKVNQANNVVTDVPVNTTDASIDSDITALDKDLADLEQSDNTLTQEVNGL